MLSSKIGIPLFLIFIAFICIMAITAMVNYNKKYPIKVHSLDRTWRAKKIDSIVGNKVYFVGDNNSHIILEGPYSIEKW